jgi:hypothetical protein
MTIAGASTGISSVVVEQAISMLLFVPVMVVRRSTIFGRLVPAAAVRRCQILRYGVAGGRFMATVLARRWR